MGDVVEVRPGPVPWVPCSMSVHKLGKRKPPPALFLVDDRPVCPFHLIEACSAALMTEPGRG